MRKTDDRRPSRMQIALPFALILLLIMGGITLLQIREHKRSVRLTAKEDLHRISSELSKSIENHLQGLRAITEAFGNSKETAEAIGRGDREELRSAFDETYTRLREIYGITHFYFHQADGKNLLRLHAPEKHGDLIERHTLGKAQKTGAASGGMELGPLGTFTLRLVRPVQKAGRVAGYIELGIELERIMETIPHNDLVWSSVFLDKKHIDREMWEAHRDSLIGEASDRGDWERYPDTVLIYSSDKALPELHEAYLRTQKEGDSAASEGFAFSGRRWCGESEKVEDISGQEVAELTVFRDITLEQKRFSRSLLTITATNGGILLVFLAGFYLLLRRNDAALNRWEEIHIEREERLRAITETARDAIIVMDPQEKISFWNPAAEEISGYGSEEAIGKSLHKLLSPPRFHPAQNAALPHFFKTGEGSAIGRTIELELLHKSGREIPVELSLSASRGSDGWSAVGIIRNITERKQEEKELRKAKEEAEELNAHLEEQTAIARDMAAEADMANAAKSMFLANMGHEIRTPLNIIIGMADLLLASELDEKQRLYADSAKKSGENLLSILNDILDYSKIEAGKIVLETVPFDLRALLDEISTMFTHIAGEKNLTFSCTMEDSLPFSLKGDPGKIRQVLLNLAGNAVKFTERGEVSIRVNKVGETDSSVLLRFSVKDTGIGIPAEQIDNLFQQFTQVDETVTRKYGGTGLGLAISKELVEMMGGRIEVESEKDAGSEFRFTIELERTFR
ncbi:MAG: ATP-binding protein [Spirochaetaceae bacterium]